MDSDRERLLSQTLVELADTLVTGFDVVEFTHLLTERCVEILGAAAAGLMLADHRGSLQIMASSDERAHLLELFELQNHEGPCLDCYRTGNLVVNEGLEGDGGRWPVFSPEARVAGYLSVHAIPMRLRDKTLGALNLFRSESGMLEEADVRAGQAMADVATIGILHQRALRESQVAVVQLEEALTSRVTIEQAKGMLAERAKVGTDQAFLLLRTYARINNHSMGEVARKLLDGKLTEAEFGAGCPKPDTPQRP